MTTKIKTTLLTGFFLFALLTGLQAQDKYEYALITLEKTPLNTSGALYPTKLSVFSSSTQTSDKVDKDIAERTLIQKVEEYTANGWEVYQSNSSNGTTYMYTYFLRKKKN